MRTTLLPLFSNEPLSDFSNPKERVQEQINKTLAHVREELMNKRYPLLISRKMKFTGNVFVRENPSYINEVVGRVCFASAADVDEAIADIRASKNARMWARTHLAWRSYYLKRVAQKLRDTRFFFIALMMLEVGKTAPEADAEVCEAIDLLEWYAAYAPFVEQLNNEALLNPSGERNEHVYFPAPEVPICASIQPWNFPVAISVGPAAAALVSGYSVIYKPAEQSSVIGYYVAQAFRDTGIPEDVFHFLPGRGEEVGNYLVTHPAVNAIAFTGSNAVRRSIQNAINHFNTEEILHLPHKDRYEKRGVALESGGKNAIIVDSDADLDEVVVGVSNSAFGFQGQKCSACSRLIIVDDLGRRGKTYAATVERLKERIKSLPIGSPEEPKNKIGPLVDKEALQKFNSYVALAREEGCVVSAQGEISDSLSRHGYFAPPTMLENVPVNSRSAQEEVFGPLLSVFCARTFGEALTLANNTEFALTAGVYSRNPDHISMAKKELRAGNMYINRGITGAIVGRQPFGGFKMSGNGTKAGGWDYLCAFMRPGKNITENTMRRGIPVK